MSTQGKKKSNAEFPSRSRPSSSRVPPDDACPTCGTGMRTRTGTLSLPVNGEEVHVPHVPHRYCPKCAEKVLTLEECRTLSRGAFEIYRRKHGLLTPMEIRDIHREAGLTQGEFAKLLRLGPNTLSRWEADRNVQSAALDLLLRLVRDVPQNLPYIRRRAARHLQRRAA